ncbi:MAG: T9SS type A sorting domain-containing protein [Bacteroidota bacterium]|nr:T9SS type A sorting domain-containing protein [Bacteroidota bacterium]
MLKNFYQNGDKLYIYGDSIILFRLSNINNGVNEIRQYDVIQIYPNPTHDLLYIKGFKGICSIYNVVGKEVFTGYIQEQINVQINVQNLNTGLYVIKLNNNGNEITRKIIIY